MFRLFCVTFRHIWKCPQTDSVMPSVPCIPEYLLLTQICSSSAVSPEPLCDSQGLISAHVPCGPCAGTIRCTPCGDRPLRVWAQWPHASSYNSVNYCPCATSPAHSLTLSSLLQFAETACGNVTVLLNGSIVNAFDRNRWNEAVHAALTEQEAVKW